MSEKRFMASVVKLARILGWRTYHTFNSKHSEAGFVDLVLLRPPRLIFAEIKRNDREPTFEQRVWLAELGNVPGVESYLWKPRDWKAICHVLGGG